MSDPKAITDYVRDSIIIIDSREQLPYEFPRHTCRFETLHTGDYSIIGPDGRSFRPHGSGQSVAVERKSLDDIINSCLVGRPRFEKEFQRAMDLTYFAVVIEAQILDILNWAPDRPTGKVIVNTLISWGIKYHVPVWFAGCRNFGQTFTERILEKFIRSILLSEKGKGKAA